MIKRLLTLLVAAGATLCASAAPTASILTVKESIQDNSIIYPESFETDTQELMKSWYLQGYIVSDSTETTDVPTTDEDYIARLKALPTVIEMPYNSIVKSYIEMYTQRRRGLVEQMLGLSLYYCPIFEQALEKEGLPLELKYLPVIESALNPNAVSRVGATGLWQFMLGTAKGLQLEVNSLVDERRDPYRSSEMAAKYLKTLYNMYGDWSLAIASYNCGPGNVNKALRRAGGGKKDFWEIYFYLPAETRGYVPAFIAANYVMTYYKDHNFGNSVARRPIITDTVSVNKRVHFNQISSVLNIPIEEVRIFNPQYRQDEIPGDIHPYMLTLPSQQIYSYIVSEDSIVSHDAELYARRTTVEPGMSADGKTMLVTKYHKVQRNETLSTIARKYGVSTSSIKKWNGLRSSRLRRGQNLKIEVYEKVEEKEETPMLAESTTPKETAENEPMTAPEAEKEPVTEPEPEKKTTSAPENPEYHKVQRGETLAIIANNYGVTINQLREWNNIEGNTIMAGQSLLVDGSKAKPSKPRATTHTVRRGENLSVIADRYGVTVDDLKEWNNLSSNDLQVGDKLSINGKASSTSGRSSSGTTTHTVRRGESLGSIAERYGVSVSNLRAWNNISGSRIDVGQKLIVKGGSSSSRGSKAKSATYHKVKSGETLGEIAEKYGTSASAIRRANGIKGSTIRVGQRLRIP